MEKERKAVQSEWAGFTVTKQQSNKSALALRNVNPCSAIFISRQRLEKRKTANKKLLLFLGFFGVFFEKSRWGRFKKKNLQEVLVGGAPV